MIHVRLYRSLAGAVVEVSCAHGDESVASSHLVYRSQVDVVDDDASSVWVSLADEVSRAARLAYEDRVEVFDDCGW